MGRPVFRVFTLDELVRGSHAIVVARFEDPRARVEEGTGETFHRVFVEEILDENPLIQRSMMSSRDLQETRIEGLAVGSALEILSNVTRLRDMSLRRASPSGSGASFPARRYRTDQDVLSHDALIFFISRGERHVEETADLSVETLSRRAEVEAAIARRRAPPPSGP